VTVSPVGSATANGTALINAISGIVGASATNPWLVRIEPGAYNLGSTTLSVPGYVDIEGSGENSTQITGTGQACFQPQGTTAMRHMTVTNTGVNSAGIDCKGPCRIMHVTVSGTLYSLALEAGGVVYGSTATGASASGANISGSFSVSMSIFNSTVGKPGDTAGVYGMSVISGSSIIGAVGGPANGYHCFGSWNGTTFAALSPTTCQ